MVPSNLHTHTVYCDGKNTPSEMVEKAVELGCPCIGFSGHGYTDFDTSYCMSCENTVKYIEEIKALKEEYKDKITVLCGVEQDYYSDEPTDGYDYVIGSLHYVKVDGEYYTIDLTEENTVKIVNDVFHGDWYAFCESYYATLEHLYDKTHCTIVGHFDLVTKYNEGNRFFDTNHPRYIAAADKALKALLKAPVAFEINTGAMARGLRTSPYPEERLLKQIVDAGKDVVKNSDCHDKNKLLFGLTD